MALYFFFGDFAHWDNNNNHKDDCFIFSGEYEYQLWLKFDLYTKKNTQWFYFQVKNTRPNVIYKFTIMNFLKVETHFL